MDLENLLKKFYNSKFFIYFLLIFFIYFIFSLSTQKGGSNSNNSLRKNNYISWSFYDLFTFFAAIFEFITYPLKFII